MTLPLVSMFIPENVTRSGYAEVHNSGSILRRESPEVRLWPMVLPFTKTLLPDDIAGLDILS